MKHSVEQMGLLLSYLSLLGIWLAIPSVGLFIKKDHRWSYVAIAVLILAVLVVVAYIKGWRTLFPDMTLSDIEISKKQKLRN